MKDSKGNPVSVGDRVYVNKRGGDDSYGPGYVRVIKEQGTRSERCRVDDGPADMGDTLVGDYRWTWSAWVSASEFEVIDKAETTLKGATPDPH